MALDENGYVTYQKVVECSNLNKTKLYKRAMDYFVYNYRDVNSVIQTEMLRMVLLCEGVFKNVHSHTDVLLSNIIDTWHLLKLK